MSSSRAKGGLRRGGDEGPLPLFNSIPPPSTTVQAFVRVQPNISSPSSSCLPFYRSSRVSDGWSHGQLNLVSSFDFSMSCEQSIPLTAFVSFLCCLYLCFLRLFAKRLRHCLANDGATSVHVTKHLYGVRLRDLVYMTSIYMK